MRNAIHIRSTPQSRSSPQSFSFLLTFLFGFFLFLSFISFGLSMSAWKKFQFFNRTLVREAGAAKPASFFEVFSSQFTSPSFSPSPSLSPSLSIFLPFFLSLQGVQWGTGGICLLHNERPSSSFLVLLCLLPLTSVCVDGCM
jgi:hypothetical protein